MRYLTLSGTLVPRFHAACIQLRNSADDYLIPLVVRRTAQTTASQLGWCAANHGSSPRQVHTQIPGNTSAHWLARICFPIERVRSRRKVANRSCCTCKEIVTSKQACPAAVIGPLPTVGCMLAVVLRSGQSWKTDVLRSA